MPIMELSSAAGPLPRARFEPTNGLCGGIATRPRNAAPTGFTVREDHDHEPKLRFSTEEQVWSLKTELT
ncbi:hypothetical protein CMV_028046 [Castanea mollissima]|uniref:Uncharacterized protein n=1 Tax=Castanea mollissima TaxID=60419 RepID=A0A8J4QEE9_9ROSI|nr:hypothetical protein CMV_028046 [Castanea mollissima]